MEEEEEAALGFLRKWEEWEVDAVWSSPSLVCSVQPIALLESISH